MSKNNNIPIVWRDNPYSNDWIDNYIKHPTSTCGKRGGKGWTDEADDAVLKSIDQTP